MATHHLSPLFCTALRFTVLSFTALSSSQQAAMLVFNRILNDVSESLAVSPRNRLSTLLSRF